MRFKHGSTEVLQFVHLPQFADRKQLMQLLQPRTGL